MFKIEADVKDMIFDFVLSHTCPYSWQPFDLFLSQVDQHSVDNTMERWMDNLKDEIHWKYAWLFGHFHDDRIVQPHVEMYMNKYDTLDNIAQRWKDWDDGYRFDWYLKLDPTWYFWQEEFNKRKFKPDTYIFGVDVSKEEDFSSNSTISI